MADAALKIKAEGIKILDIRPLANFCDYFVICTGHSSRQVRAIADGIDDSLAEIGVRLKNKQGAREGRWILCDLGHVVAHIFDPETRDFYGLEYLWQEAASTDWPPSPA